MKTNASNVMVRRQIGKVHPVQALRLCRGRTAHRWSRGIALPFHDHCTRRREGSASRPGRSLPRERLGTHCTGGLVGPRAGLDRCGKFRPPTGIRSPDRPARSQSIYRLRDPVHSVLGNFNKCCRAFPIVSYFVHPCTGTAALYRPYGP